MSSMVLTGQPMPRTALIGRMPSSADPRRGAMARDRKRLACDRREQSCRMDVPRRRDVGISRQDLVEAQFLARLVT